MVLTPIANGYVAVTPAPACKGIENIFSNFNDLTGTLAAVFQGRLGDAGGNVARFLVNSTMYLPMKIGQSDHYQMTMFRTKLFWL